MINRTRRLATLLLTSALLMAGFAGTASAQPVNQDGLVNVNVGDVTILEDVNVAAAVDAVVQACGINVGPLALGILGQATAVDRSGRTRTVCTTDDGDVTISQN